jgi:hypothetical protein
MATKVTMNREPTPMAGAPAVRAEKPGVSYTTDATGRRIGYRKLSALEKMRVLKYVGAAASENRPYVGMAILAASVREINSEIEPFPQSERQIEAIIGQLDDVGVEAVAELMQTLHADIMPGDEDQIAGK